MTSNRAPPLGDEASWCTSPTYCPERLSTRILRAIRRRGGRRGSALRAMHRERSRSLPGKPRRPRRTRSSRGTGYAIAWSRQPCSEPSSRPPGASSGAAAMVAICHMLARLATPSPSWDYVPRCWRKSAVAEAASSIASQRIGRRWHAAGGGGVLDVVLCSHRHPVSVDPAAGNYGTGVMYAALPFARQLNPVPEVFAPGAATVPICRALPLPDSTTPQHPLWRRGAPEWPACALPC